MASGVTVTKLDPKVRTLNLRFDQLPHCYNSERLICSIYPVPIQLTNLTIDEILHSITLDNSFHHSSRKTAYYGDYDYAYSTTLHVKKSITETSFLSSCIKTINQVFPSAEVNSVLINYYPNGKSVIPFHSDNEPSICQNSSIFTYSIGQSRTMLFRDLITKKLLCKTRLDHNSLIIFPKLSQSCFEHSIVADNSVDPRLSLTFRRLK